LESKLPFVLYYLALFLFLCQLQTIFSGLHLFSSNVDTEDKLLDGSFPFL
jgi:hypothetical protein